MCQKNIVSNNNNSRKVSLDLLLSTEENQLFSFIKINVEKFQFLENCGKIAEFCRNVLLWFKNLELLLLIIIIFLTNQLLFSLFSI